MPGVMGIPLDVLAGSSLLGSYRLPELSKVACVCRKMREAAGVAAARNTALSLAGSWEGEDAVQILLKLPSLTALNLAGEPSAVSECLQTLFGATERCDGAVGRPTPAFCSSLTCLRSCGLQECGVIERAVSACGQLRALGLRSSAVGDGGVSSIAAACPLLRAVDLSNTQTGDDGVGMLLLQCDNLRELALRACPISDAALDSIALGASSLDTLDVGFCKQLTDEGVQRLTSPLQASCQHLRSLHLTKCKL